MSVIYFVEEALASSGPWIAVSGSPFSTTTDVVGGLSASTAYYFRITAKDTVLGITATPTVVGPVVTSASGAIESAQNTRLSSSAATTVPPVGVITAISSSAGITGITLSSTMVLSGATSGTVVGQIGVTMTGGTFNGTLSVGGANASNFSIVGSNLVTVGALSNGTYQITLTATQPGASNSPFTSPFTISVQPAVPAPASAVGYNTLTFGPAVQPLGTNLRAFSFFGTVPGNPTQNADGSITITTPSTGFGADLCTAGLKNGASTWPDFQGIAFGGGCYAEAVMSMQGANVNPGMSFWLNDIESMNGGSVGDLTGRHWPGQASDYGNWIEVDIAEFDASGDSYGCGNHNWYGTASSFADANTGSYPGFVSPVTPGTGIDWSQPHRYGWLWVPATGGNIGFNDNIMPNSNETGAVVGSPGTLPNGWNFSRLNGLSYQVVAIGTSGGNPSIDIRLFGTANGSSDINMFLCPINGFTATPSTQYNFVVGLAVVGGSLPGNPVLDVDDFRSVGTGDYITSTTGPGLTVTSTATDFTLPVKTTSDTAGINCQVAFFGPSAGTSVDFTLRIVFPRVSQLSAPTSANGYQKFFFDGVQVGTTLFWNQWSSSETPPPQQGTTAYNVLDTRHVAFIFGCGDPARPVTVHSLSVWQASTTNNLGTQTGVQALTANSFLNSTGIGTHIDQGFGATGSTSYYIPEIQYTGFRNFRTGVGNLSTVQAVCSATGAKAMINCHATDIPSTVTFLRTLASAGQLLALEGINEANNFPITYNGATGGGSGDWLPVAQYMRDLYAAKAGDSVLQAYQLFAATEPGAQSTNAGLQWLTTPTGSGTQIGDNVKLADYANVHNYVSSNQLIHVDNQAWSAADGTGGGLAFDTIQGNFTGTTWLKGYTAAPTSQSNTIPRVTTETGWDGSDSNVPNNSLAVQGKMLTNCLLAQFKRGWAYTFIYEMIDAEASSQNQGLYTANPTRAAKPAADYVHNLTTILADTTEFTTNKLDYSIPSQPSTVHDLLLQKASGRFELVVWGESVSATNPITVNFGRIFANVNVYDITVGTSPVSSFSNTGSVNLTMTDHALIIELY
jgi:hypothetical protein